MKRPKTILKTNRKLLINHGPEQVNNLDFYFPENVTDKRRFTFNWFTKIFSNGEKVESFWLMYRNKPESLYCFLCMLFENKTMNSSAITKPKQGFNSWKNVKTKIPDHENSNKHRMNIMFK